MSRWLTQLYRNVGQGFKRSPVIINGIPIGPQPNNWSCGPTSLRHCLLARGRDIDVAKLAKWAGSTRTGTDDDQLIAAALRAGHDLKPMTRRSSGTAKRLIVSRLKKGNPLILCVERWSHWIVVLHHGTRGFLVLDSSRPGPVIRLLSWRRLERLIRLTYSARFKEWFENDRRPNYFIMELSKPVHRSK